MEAPAQIPCSGRCLVHLHSEAGSAWLMRRTSPYPHRLGPDGLFYYLVKLGNNDPAFVSAHEIHTFHLRYMIDNFERDTDLRVKNIVAFIPASINPNEYKSQLSAIAASAGVCFFQFMERSVLAASSYQSLLSPGHRTVLVFELGGPILEISLFNENSCIKKTAAVFDLGCPLFNHMISVLPSTLGAIDFKRDASFLCDIRTKCERAKDALCLGSGTVEIKIQRRGSVATTSIDRESLVQLNLNHLRSGIRSCLSEAGVRQEAVDKVVLAGASSVIPEVLSVLLEFFQRQSIRDALDPANLIRSAMIEYRNNLCTENAVTGIQTFNLGLYAL